MTNVKVAVVWDDALCGSTDADHDFREGYLLPPSSG
jgi:hypothetical protein